MHDIKRSVRLSEGDICALRRQMYIMHTFIWCIYICIIIGLSTSNVTTLFKTLFDRHFPFAAQIASDEMRSITPHTPDFKSVFIEVQWCFIAIISFLCCPIRVAAMHSYLFSPLNSLFQANTVRSIKFPLNV